MTDTNDDATGESNADATDAGRSSRRAWLQAIGLLGLAGVGSRSASAATGHFGEDWSGSASSDAGLEVYNTSASGTAIGLKGRTDSPAGYGVQSRGPLSVADLGDGTVGFEVNGDGTVQFYTAVYDSRRAPMMQMFPSGYFFQQENQPVIVHSGDTPDLGLHYETGGYFVFRDANANDTVYLRFDSAGPYLEVAGDAKVDGAMRTVGGWQVVVDGNRALELGSQSSGDAGRVVHGHSSNAVQADAVGATISGGGFDDGSVSDPNVVTDDYGTVGGGRNNRAGSDDGDSTTATDATVGGGSDNVAAGDDSTVAGGVGNHAEANESAVAGGAGNWAQGGSSFIGGGGDNQANGRGATVAGGLGNVAEGRYATVGGGVSNQAVYESSTVSGGDDNDARAPGGTIPGGRGNVVEGVSALAAGQYAFAENDHTFVWADGTDSSSDRFSSADPANGSGVTGPGTFHVKSSEGVRMLTGAGTTFIPGGSTGWSVTSTRAAKTNVDPVDPQQVLDGVESLEVSTWEYEGEDGDGAGVQHVGPMAGEFHDAFEVGSSDEHINSVNADGVALAAIQGLSERLDDREERIETLEAENEALRDRLSTLEEHVGLDAGDGSPAPADD